MILLECDLSAAESRILLMYTRDPKCIEVARTVPWEFDMHRHNAARIFGVAEKAVTKDQRYFGKKTVHAAQGGMYGKKMADELLKEGIVMTPDECDRLINAYHAANPAIRDVYFADIRKQVFRYRCVSNSWDRRIWFTDERLDDEVYRRAYRFPPQSDCADTLNQWGFKPLYYWMRDSGLAARYAEGRVLSYPKELFTPIRQQGHDALLISCRVQDAFDIASRLKYTLERPRLYAGEPMTIWAEFGLGSTWKKTFEFKRLPSRDEFTEAALACERAQREAA